MPQAQPCILAPSAESLIGALAEIRATVLPLVLLLQSTTLTPAASPRAKTAGMHSWMGLLGSEQSCTELGCITDTATPLTVNPCKYWWYFSSR